MNEKILNRYIHVTKWTHRQFSVHERCAVVIVVLLLAALAKVQRCPFEADKMKVNVIFRAPCTSSCTPSIWPIARIRWARGASGNQK